MATSPLFYAAQLSAGFPSPANGHAEGPLDLNEYLIKNKEATFFVSVTGKSMLQAGIDEGDLLIIDRSIESKNNHIILAVLDGEFTIKRLNIKPDHVVLRAENPYFPSIVITNPHRFSIWGVVTSVIKQLVNF